MNTAFVRAKTSGGKIVYCELAAPDGARTFEPKIIIDSSADIEVAVAAGCKYDVGEDPFDKYGESIAPQSASRALNGLTLCFKIEPDANAPTLTSPDLSASLRKTVTR